MQRSHRLPVAFATGADAERMAVERRPVGAPDGARSAVTRHAGATTTIGGHGKVTDCGIVSVARGALGEGVPGVGPGMAAIAIPGEADGDASTRSHVSSY